MSSFFTLPASQRKRKRSQPSESSNARRKDSRDNESISGSDVSEDEASLAAEHREVSEDEDDEFEDEDPAAKRIRLAEQYLANTQAKVLEDGGFDAAEIDEENLRRRMGERLREDTAETKGKLYRWIADGIDWQGAERKICRQDGLEKSPTGIAIHGNHVYVVSKDLQLVKLELPKTHEPERAQRRGKTAKVIARSRGNKKAKDSQHHIQPILCLAVSPDGKFVATGGADRRLIVWDAESLNPVKVFPQHRDAVTALAFRRGTNQLFSASKDRTVKTWSLDELAYVETLFGHGDEVVDVDALAQENCVSVGSRDRTARFWKVVEEQQLLFRGGGAPGTTKALEALRHAYGDGAERNAAAQGNHHEGSIDRVTMIDDDMFVTGSDNGSLALWNINKKKAIFTLPLAHGLDPPLPLEEASAELVPDETLDESGRGGRQPRWITALKAIPFSDLFISGSWDGHVRAWKISKDKRRIESLGAVGSVVQSLDIPIDTESLGAERLTNGALEAVKAGIKSQDAVHGIVNDLAIVDRGDRGKEGVLIAAALGREHRLGRWKEVLDAKNCIVLFSVPLKNDRAQQNRNEEENGPTFNGFD